MITTKISVGANRDDHSFVNITYGQVISVTSVSASLFKNPVIDSCGLMLVTPVSPTVIEFFKG